MENYTEEARAAIKRIEEMAEEQKDRAWVNPDGEEIGELSKEEIDRQLDELEWCELCQSSHAGTGVAVRDCKAD